MQTLVNDTEGWIQFIIEDDQRNPLRWLQWYPILLLLLFVGAALRVRGVYYYAWDLPLHSHYTICLVPLAPYHQEPPQLRTPRHWYPPLVGVDANPIKVPRYGDRDQECGHPSGHLGLPRWDQGQAIGVAHH